MDLTRQLNTAIYSIKEASKIIMAVYHDDFIVSTKEDDSVVTIADLQSDKKLREILLNEFPDYGMLSEETKDDKQRRQKDFCWIVDPLDGTKDFVNRTNEFSINIALSYKGEIVLGVIAVPVLNIIYYATKGQGAFKIVDDIVTPIHTNAKNDKYTLVVSNFFFKDEEVNYINNYHLIDKMIRCGSSYKACKIAEGNAELCIKFDAHTKEWDTAPSEIIVSEAGGYMSDIYGNRITYNRENVVNENGFIISNSYQTSKNFFK